MAGSMTGSLTLTDKEKKVDEVVAKLKEQVAKCKTAHFKDDEATTWFEPFWCFQEWMRRR